MRCQITFSSIALTHTDTHTLFISAAGKPLADTCFEVVCLSREGHNQPHTLKDTRPVPQVWGTFLFLEKPAHETGQISDDDNVFIKNQSSSRIWPVVFSFQVKHQRNSDRPETGQMHFRLCSGIMKSRCGSGLEHIWQARWTGQMLQMHIFPRKLQRYLKMRFHKHWAFILNVTVAWVWSTLRRCRYTGLMFQTHIFPRKPQRYFKKRSHKH